MRIFITLLLLTLIGCKSIKSDTYYENRLTRVRVKVVFVGNESSLTKRFDQKFKYQYSPQDEPFVVYMSNQNYDSYEDNLKISSEKSFLSEYSKVQ